MIYYELSTTTGINNFCMVSETVYFLYENNYTVFLKPVLV
jgi:hypothetical protein